MNKNHYSTIKWVSTQGNQPISFAEDDDDDDDDNNNNDDEDNNLRLI